jgi:hypothetical protein
LRTIQCKIKQKYGVILKQFLEGGMKNFAFQNRVLQWDRVLQGDREARTREGLLYLKHAFWTQFNLDALL